MSEELLQLAGQAHPQLLATVDAARFVTFAKTKPGPYAGDLLVTFAALEQQAKALDLLEQYVKREVAGAVSRMGGTESFAAEVEQRLFTHLVVGAEGKAPKLHEYSARGPIGAWLRAAALGIALNLRRAQRSTTPDSDENAPIAASNPEIDCLKASCGESFGVAFREAMASMEPKERNLLRLRFIDGLTLPALATYFRVHRATVVRWLAEVTERLFQLTQQRLEQRLGSAAPNVVSVLRAAGSRADFSLNQLLGSLG